MSRLERQAIRRAVGAACAAAGLALTGCGSADESATKVPVVAAFAPLQEAAQRIGGDRVAVTNLTPIGGQPHDLVPTPEAITAMRRAKVVLTMGAALQPEVSRQSGTLPPTVRVVDLLEGTTVRSIPKPVAGMKGSIEAARAGDPDPHAWVDPVGFRAMAVEVQAALIEADPDGRAGYESRGRAYLAQLDALGRDYSSGLAGCKGAVLLSTHPAYGYLAERAGLTESVTAGIAPGARPSAAALRALASFAKENAVQTLFFSTAVPSRLATQLKRETGLDAGVLNPFEGLTQDQARAGADYVSVMRDDLQRLQHGLGCDAT